MATNNFRKYPPATTNTATWWPPAIKSVHVCTGHKPHCNQARTNFFIYFLGHAIRLAHFLFPDLCPCPPKRGKEKEQKQCLQVKALDFLWKLDFLFWSLHDSHFEVVGVFKLFVGSIFFRLWLFPLVLWCFFPLISLSSVLVLFSAFSFLRECSRVSQGKQRLPAGERGRRWKERWA